MSTDCKHENIANSYKITKDGVLVSVLECEDCGMRETEINDTELSNVPEHLRGYPKETLFTLNKIFNR
jgi:hypothetical protein